MKAFGMCHRKGAHSRVRGERFLNGRNPALPLCYTTGKSGQNCRPRTMNGIHTPFILDERGRKLTHSYTKGKKKGRLPLKEKAPLKQLGYALFLATQESLGLGNDVVASIQLMAVTIRAWLSITQSAGLSRKRSPINFSNFIVCLLFVCINGR